MHAHVAADDPLFAPALPTHRTAPGGHDRGAGDLAWQRVCALLETLR